MKNEKLNSFEQELEKNLKVQELEERLEMGLYCCDYDPSRPDRMSCGYEP